MRSRISSSLNVPKLQYLARPCRSVINLSTDSPSRWILEYEFRSFEDNISFYDEVVFKFLFHLFVVLFFFRG